MTSNDRAAGSALAASWSHGVLPGNVTAGVNTAISGEIAFKRFRSRREPALVIGAHCTMDGVQFAIGERGIVTIGDYCYFTNAILLCELELRMGNYVVIGWNTTIADTDFHPLAPAVRIADAIACSPLGEGRARPEVPQRAVVIEDDVWIGAGSFIEPGALITRDVPARSRVGGNPAVVIEHI
jgi:acetyltransferase-like isoleucine patch superfamily enzyme